MNTTDNAYQFSLENLYMFHWPFGVYDLPTVIVSKPLFMDSEEIVFLFLYGYRSEFYSVKKKEILAVSDNNGTVRVKGWKGRYKILNEELFNKNIEEEIIELKN